MREFKSGYDLEDAIFGRHSGGEEMVKKFWDYEPEFNRDIKDLIKRNYGIKHPNTHIGEDFFHRLEWKLCCRGIDTKGLVFLPAMNSPVDLRLFADGVVWLPAVEEYPITIDAYNSDVRGLREGWFESFAGHYYTLADYQNDIFRYKAGRSKWLSDAKKVRSEGFELEEPTDFREYTDARRPENHFIWTPQDITYHGRKLFTRIFADYLISKVPHPEMALLSP